MVNVLKLGSDSCSQLEMLELKFNATEEPLQDFRLFAKGSVLRA
jgi:hypothetical protein